MTRLRASFCTYNLWNTQRWPEREAPLRGFLRTFQPDVLAVQELREPVRDCIDATLRGHRRVIDPGTGWAQESNLWWRDALFEYVEHGAHDFGSHEATRALFWVRLTRRDGGGTLIAATAHLTHTSHEHEATTGQSPRIEQTRAIRDGLARIAGSGEPVWLMGDFNDPFHPSQMLHEAGYTSCFADLGLQPPPTFPAMPTAARGGLQHQFNVCFDWITAKGPARALAAHSPRFFQDDLSPSDHWPVLAVYDLDAAGD